MERFGTYDFGLTPEQEERAARLHAESVVVDMLFAGPCGYRAFSAEETERLVAELDRTGDLWRVFTEAYLTPPRRAVAGDPEFRATWEASGITAGNRETILDWSEAPLGVIAEWMAAAIAQFDHLPWLRKALTAGDIRKAKERGERASFVTTQHADGLFRPNGLVTVDALAIAHDLGVRMIQLTYNTMNFIGAGCSERGDVGLSTFGVAFVRRMNELGIVVDTAHCGRQTTLDACAHSTAPVVASHTSAAALYDVQRAKSDEELRALAATGGVIGVYAVPFFLAPGGGVTIEAMLDHVDHIAGLVGVEHVAIGTDWPNQIPQPLMERIFTPFITQLGFGGELEPLAMLEGFDDYRDFPNITRGLVARGFDDDAIRGILGENVLRVFEAVCG